MTNGNYEFEVLVNGRPVREYLHNGKIYIEGRKGSRFSLRIRNNTWEQILGVPSVDGLSVMDGKPCSIHTSRGYIVPAHGAVKFSGWRKNEREVAEFYFSELGDSYVQRSGKDDSNLGVIGLAVFKKEQPAYTAYGWSGTTLVGPSGHSGIAVADGPEIHTYNVGVDFSAGGGGGSKVYTMAATAQNTTATASRQKQAAVSVLGRGHIDNTLRSYGNPSHEVDTSGLSQDVATGWGATRKEEIKRAFFGRKSQPEEVFTIYYNTRENLQKIGIDVFRQAVYATPSPFPGDEYCEEPTR